MAKKIQILDIFKRQSKFQNLKKLNIILAILLLAQAVIILIVAKGQSVPINTNFLTLDSLASTSVGHTVLASATKHLFDIRIEYLVAAFLLAAAVARGLTATKLRKKYEADLKKQINRWRWGEYIIVGGLILLTVSLINGVYDISTLIAIFALTEILGLFALLVETNSEIGQKHPRVTNKLAFVAWLTPWLIVAFYLFGAQIYGHYLPVYVYIVDATVLLLFIAKIANMYLTGHKKDRWADYIYGETLYLILGFILQTALAWQIFFGALRP